MSDYTASQSRGAQVPHVRGATGRLEICSRCGWARVELADGDRSLGFGPRTVHPSFARPMAEGRRL